MKRGLVGIYVLCLVCIAYFISCGGSTDPKEDASTDGDMDLGFGVGGLVVSEIRCEVQDIAVQSDGKIVLAGNGFSNFSDKNNFMLIRYNANGDLDSSFGASGIASINIDGSPAHLTNIVIQSDGRTILSGRTQQVHALVRCQEDGSLDGAFGVGGILATGLNVDDCENPVGVHTTGTAIVAGCSGQELVLLAYDAQGNPEATFGTDGVVVFDMAAEVNMADLRILPDRRFVVAGSVDGDAFVARFLEDGSADSMFGNSGIAVVNVDGDFMAAKILDQPDGMLVLTGFLREGFDATFAMMRYEIDGSLDETFGTGGIVREPDVEQTGLFDWVGDPAVQLDGKILVAGVGNMVFSVFRYTADGTTDMDFGTQGVVLTDLASTGGWDHARAIGLQPDGKIVVAGCAGSASVAVVRYWS